MLPCAVPVLALALVLPVPTLLLLFEPDGVGGGAHEGELVGALSARAGGVGGEGRVEQGVDVVVATVGAEAVGRVVECWSWCGEVVVVRVRVSRARGGGEGGEVEAGVVVLGVLGRVRYREARVSQVH